MNVFSSLKETTLVCISQFLQCVQNYEIVKLLCIFQREGTRCKEKALQRD